MLLTTLIVLFVVHTVIVGGTVLLEKRSPTSAWAWLLAITFLPFVGVWIYLLIGRRRFRLRTAHIGRAARLAHSELPSPEESAGSAGLWAPGGGEVHPAQRALMTLALNIGELPVTRGNRADMLQDGVKVYPAIEEAIRAAKHFVHLEYYIFQPGETGRRFRDLLVERARAGVEVRLLADHIGSFEITDSFLEPLREAGGRFAFSMRTRFPHLLNLWRINYRNHRKLVVVDGAIAFTGGVNVADSYLLPAGTDGYWRDTHLRVEGAAAVHLQRTFTEDWLHATGELLEEPRYYPPAAQVGDALVQILPSGPDRVWLPAHKLYFEAIATAQARVYVTSPYFVPDATILAAFTTAALKGVDVRLLVPGRSDMAMVRLAGRSYFEELLQAGVRIYEYQAGILHAKTLTADGRYVSIGSANMDIRSFRLNFELNALLYSEDCASELEGVFLRDLEQAREITLEELSDRPLLRRLPERFARLLSSLL